MDGRSSGMGAAVLALIATALAACGTTTQLPEAPSSTPLTASHVTINQTGNGPASIDKSSVTFVIDISGSLVVRLNLRSNAAKSQTFSLQGTLFDPTGLIIGNVSGGEINVQPGSTVPIQLNGQTPSGTIASATFEVTAVAAPTSQ